MCDGQTTFCFFVIVTRMWHTDLFQILFGLKLILVLVAYDRVGRVSCRSLFLYRDTKAAIVDSLGHPDERLYYHINREVLPLVECAPELLFISAAFRIDTS